MAFLEVREVARTRPASAVLAQCTAFVEALLSSTDYTYLAAEPAVAGYRELHRQLGKSGRQFLPSQESLFKQIFKRGAWRAIDPLVDAYSLVSLRTRVSIGAHDLAQLRLPVCLDVTVGGEQLLAIGEAEPLTLTAGEYCYRDAAGQVLGRMECRQAEATKVTAATREILFILQGHAQLSGDTLREVAAVLCTTLDELVGPYGASELTVLD